MGNIDKDIEIECGEIYSEYTALIDFIVKNKISKMKAVVDKIRDHLKNKERELGIKVLDDTSRTSVKEADEAGVVYLVSKNKHIDVTTDDSKGGIIGNHLCVVEIYYEQKQLKMRLHVKIDDGSKKQRWIKYVM